MKDFTDIYRKGLRIAVLNIYSGLANRGAETVVKELATRWSEHHRVVVFQGGNESGKVNYKVVKVPNVKLMTTDTDKGLKGKIKRALYQDSYSREVEKFSQSVMPYLLAGDFDIVVAFNGYPQLKVLNKYHSKLKAKIVYPNGSGFHSSILKLAGWDNWMKLKARPDAFVALNEEMYKWAKRYSAQSTKVVKVYNGVDLKKFNPFVKPAKIDLPKPLILCVAGLQKYKRVELLIRAVAKTNQMSSPPLLSSPRRRGSTHRNLRGFNSKLSSQQNSSLGSRLRGNDTTSLLVLGDGPLKKNLESLGNELLSKQHFKIMSVPYSEIQHYYVACDVFSLPSESLEAFGVSYLEAMASNKPVVAPDDELRREIIGEGGILTDVTDVAKYADALQFALQKNLANIPRKQAEKFNWNEIAGQYEQLFASL